MFDRHVRTMLRCAGRCLEIAWGVRGDFLHIVEEPPQMIYRFDECELDALRCELRRAGEPRHLEPQVLDLLLHLLRNRDRVVPQAELLDAVWEHRFVAPATLSSRIRDAREAVGDDGSAQRIIRTVRGRGYRLVAEVVEVAPMDVWSQRDGDRASTARQALLVGREGERAALERAWHGALEGRRGVVFVAGDPGSGKTALLEAFLAGLSEHSPDPSESGEPTLWIGRGQCLDHRGAGEPFMPVLEAFGRLGRGEGGPELVGVLRRLAPSWLRQMPALTSSMDHAGPEGGGEPVTRGRMAREMVEAVEELAAARPLILVFEDLHWSDPSTLDLIGWLAQRPESTRLLVLTTYRPAEADPQVERLVAHARSHGQAILLNLPGWSCADVVEYVASHTRDVGSKWASPADVRLTEEPGREDELREVARRIWARSGGNPLFVQLLLEASSEPVITEDAGSDSVLRSPHESEASSVPASIRMIIDQQLERLEREDRELLEAAAVAGVEFSVESVAAALDQPEEATEARLVPLVRRRRFVQPAQPGEVGLAETTDGARYSFSHQLFPEVLYGRIPPARRARLHRAIGEWLESRLGERRTRHAVELALHFERGRDDLRAVGYLEAAARQALTRSAHREAVAHLKSAMAIIQRRPDLPEATARELALQRMYASSRVVLEGWGDTEAERSYARARELADLLDDESQTARVLYGQAYMMELRGEFAASQALLEERLRLCTHERDPRLQVQSHELLSCSLFHQGCFEEALNHARQAIEAANGQSSPTNLVDVEATVGSHFWSGLAQWFLGRTECALASVRNGLRSAVACDMAFMKSAAEFQAARLHQFRREPGPAAAHATRALAIAETQGFPYPRALAWSIRGWTFSCDGDPETGIELLRRALSAQQEVGAGMERPYCMGLLAECLLDAERLDEAEVVLDEALELVSSGGRSFFWEPELRRAHARLALARSEPDAAGTRLQQAFDVAQGQGSRALALRAASARLRLMRSTGMDEDPARATLQAVYAGFEEGFETADLKEAGALLSA